MGSLRSSGLLAAVAIISLCGIGGCGGHKVTPLSPFPAKISLSPGNTTSAQLGSVIGFTAAAQNASGTNLTGTTFTFSSSDTSILNIAANGIACAGRWDPTFTICTPAGIGVVQVTASALGATSLPTYVFVHLPIDNITVS